MLGWSHTSHVTESVTIPGSANNAGSAAYLFLTLMAPTLSRLARSVQEAGAVIPSLHWQSGTTATNDLDDQTG